MAGADQHDVALADRRPPAPCRRCLQVARGDDLADLHPLDALRTGHVEQHAAREEDADVLDPELRQAVGRAELRALEAVVEVVVAADPDADMAQAVELGADLADLAAEQLVVVDPLVLAARARRSASRGSSG